jgi:hypothetical protein
MTHARSTTVSFGLCKRHASLAYNMLNGWPLVDRTLYRSEANRRRVEMMSRLVRTFLASFPTTYYRQPELEISTKMHSSAYLIKTLSAIALLSAVTAVPLHGRDKDDDRVEAPSAEDQPLIQLQVGSALTRNANSRKRLTKAFRLHINSTVSYRSIPIIGLIW